jgi:hypothetical protein
MLLLTYNYNNNDDGSNNNNGNSYNKYNNCNCYNYNTTNHLGQATFIFTTGLAGLALAFVAFGYMLRHGETILKTTIVFTTTMCLGVAVVGLFIGERFMCIAGLVGFGVASMYMNMMWRRIPVSVPLCVPLCVLLNIGKEVNKSDVCCDVVEFRAWGVALGLTQDVQGAHLGEAESCSL